MVSMTKQELWLQQAPSFNFELDEDQLLKKALEAGFVKRVSSNQYEVNENYGETSDD
jgi:hypothetical protein